MSYDLGFDIDPFEESEILRFELQRDQETFLYKIEELWYEKDQEDYIELLKTVSSVLEKGWYDDEEQFDLREVVQLYKDDLKR